MRQYVTTAIDYANAVPHMGHVMEKILADVVARWFRLRGDDVLFQIGMDEHGIKIQETAAKRKMTPHDLVEKIVPTYRDLYERLDISFDRFIRTTDRKVHWPTVIELWKRLQKAGALEKRAYTGYYCQGCERFMSKRDLTDGTCTIHNAVPKEVTEENWFLLLKREGAWLQDLLTTEKDGYRIVPDSRAQETLSLIEQGLEDVSFSRPLSSLSWGIPVPDDPGQVMYVWCDALTNYISGLGMLAGEEQNNYWNDATVTHVIGKDIARFHALIWPVMLKHAKVRTPDRLLIHGFLTNEGQKMSKTIGNVVEPEEVLKHFKGDPDPLRFFLSHEIPVGNDGDFSWKRIDELYDSKLRNQLGNLLNRVLVLLNKEGAALGKIAIGNLSACFADEVSLYDSLMNNFEMSVALTNVMHLVDTCNWHFNDKQPWKLSSEEKVGVLTDFAEALRHIALMLLPFIPTTAQRISKQLNVPYSDKMLDRNFVITPGMKKWGGVKGWKTVGEPEILFKPLEEQSSKDIQFTISSAVASLGIKVKAAIFSVPSIPRRPGSELKEHIKKVLSSMVVDALLASPVIGEYKRLQRESGIAEPATPSEYLLNLIKKSGMLPNINRVVDSYNIVSAETLLSMGAHDLARIKGNLVMRVTDGSEHYVPLGKSTPEPVARGEYAAMDDEKIICRLDLKQCEQTKCTEETKDFIVYVQGNAITSDADVEDGLRKVCENIGRFCGGTYRMVEVKLGE